MRANRAAIAAILSLPSEPSNTDIIDRHVAGHLLGVTVRTLQRWHHRSYGPSRKRLLGRGVYYSRSGVELWIAQQKPKSS
jgi:hypothetical protein